MFSFTKVNVSHKKTKRVHFNFCAICHESGLPEKEYTSHCVKDQPGPSGKIICPLLLSKNVFIVKNSVTSLRAATKFNLKKSATVCSPLYKATTHQDPAYWRLTYNPFTTNQKKTITMKSAKKYLGTRDICITRAYSQFQS